MKRKVQRKKLVDTTGAELSSVPEKPLWFELDPRIGIGPPRAVIDGTRPGWDERALARMRNAASNAAHIFSTTTV